MNKKKWGNKYLKKGMLITGVATIKSGDVVTLQTMDF